MSPYKIKEECYLLRSCLDNARRMLLFMVEQVFPANGELLLMHDMNTQCTVGGERRPKKTFLCLNFCLARKYELYFTIPWTGKKRPFSLPFMAAGLTGVLPYVKLFSQVR